MITTIQQVLIPNGDRYQTVDVRLEGEKIGAIAPRLEAQGHLINGRNKLLLPGFVNAHTHSSEMWSRGAIAPLPLELWLAELYDQTLTDPEQVYLSALGTAVETLLSGGTTVVDHLSLIPGQEEASVAAVVRAYREVGIRAYVGPLVYDFSLPAGVPSRGRVRDIPPGEQTASEVLELLERIVEAYHRPENGISIMAAPTGLQLCSTDLVEGCRDLSDRYSLCRHSHLLETKAQQMLVQEKYGCSAVELFNKLGFLSDRTSLAHGVWLSDTDIDLLASTQSTVVHNPLSNLRLGSGIAPILRYRQAGVNVSFGCDGAASNDSQDLLEAIKIGSLLHNITDAEYQHWIRPVESVQMGALGGVTGLGMADQLGTLDAGKTADLVMYDLTSLSLLPRTDPIGLLVLGRPTNAVHSTWVNGKSVVVDGHVTTVDVKELRQRLFEYSQWNRLDESLPLNSASLRRRETEPHYRYVMGLSKGSQ